MRFFVLPNIRLLTRQPPEIPIQAKLTAANETTVSSGPCSAPLQSVKAPLHLTIFWHGTLRLGRNGPEVRIIHDQGSNTVKPLLGANVWVLILEGARVIGDGDLVDCFLLYPGCLASVP